MKAREAWDSIKEPLQRRTNVCVCVCVCVCMTGGKGMNWPHYWRGDWGSTELPRYAVSHHCPPLPASAAWLFFFFFQTIILNHFSQTNICTAPSDVYTQDQARDAKQNAQKIKVLDSCYTYLILYWLWKTFSHTKVTMIQVWYRPTAGAGSHEDLTSMDHRQNNRPLSYLSDHILNPYNNASSYRASHP